MNKTIIRIAAIAMMGAMVFGMVTCKKETIALPTVKVFDGAITIGYDKASVSAEVTDQGGAEVTERGFKYGVSGGPMDSTVWCGSGTGVYSAELTNLQPNTTYVYEAFAKNAGGTGTSGKVSFPTKPLPSYTIEVSANPSDGGTATGNGTYQAGESCTVKATTSTGYKFVNWTEDNTQVSTDSVYTFEVTSNRNLVAHFTTKAYTITATIEPDGSGRVSGVGEYNYGDACTLEASHEAGYVFEKWLENGQTVPNANASYPFMVSGNRILVAHFRVAEFNLAVSANPMVIPKGGSSQLNALVSGGNGSFTYSWTHASSLSNASIHNPTASPTTTTTYTCTATSAAGLTESGTCTVTVVCPPTNLTAEVQNNNQVHLSWTAPQNTVESYKVYRNNTLIKSGLTTTTYNDSNLGAGDYSYQVSAVYQNVESPKSNTASAIIYGPLSVTATANPSAISDGSSSTLTANASGGNGSYTYSWTPTTGLNNANVKSPTATPTSTTTYTVTVGSNGHTATATVQVNVVKAPTNLTATVQNTNQVRLSWTAPQNTVESYKVYRNNTLIKSGLTTTTYTDSNLSAGTYNYQVTAVYDNVESPKSNSAPATIYGSLSVSATASPSTIPYGSSSTLTANTSGGNGSYTYSWTPTTGLNNANIKSPTATPTSTTTYTVTVGSNGQTATANVTVYVVKAPTNLTASVQNTNQVRLSWTAPPNTVTSYKVYRNNTLIKSGLTTTTYTDSNLSAGNYSYQVSAVYNNVESPKSNTAQVTVYPSLNVTATASPSTIPYGNNSTLTANASGGNGSYTYSWTPTTGLNNANIQAPTATPTNTMTYNVHVGSNGQTATANVTVYVVKPPTNLTCTVNGNSVYLSWAEAYPATRYKVYRNNTLINSNVTTTHCPDNNLNSGTYTYQVSTVYNNVESPKSNSVQVTIAPQAPTGAINGLFSVSATQQVWFSQGNLQYNAAQGSHQCVDGTIKQGTWRFAPNQWDYVGQANGNISQYYNGWIDLFGWGTSGWNCGNTYYRPWDSENGASYYGPPGQYSLIGSYSYSDWGQHNTISDVAMSYTWRTLTQTEWDYVFFTRNVISGIRFAKAQVNYVNGIILLPDSWNTSYYTLYNANQSGASYSSNVITAQIWTNSLQEHGAVFLPAAGKRFLTSVEHVSDYGDYWSSSCVPSDGGARSVEFTNSFLGTGGNGWYGRQNGMSVRLVQEY